jgi:7-carboxy-7-deazaguanine synthase (Cx14CxxC type)
MAYSVKEIYRTLQGEGAQSGRPAVFCRFSGCNLWNGHEQSRASAACTFCDTDFVGTDGPGGGKFATPDDLAVRIAEVWGVGRSKRFVVLTGGEPLLQLDALLLDALHAAEFEVAVETNGTLGAPPGLDWICVSPKSGAPLRLRAGNELKLVYPQIGIDPAELITLNFDHFFLQPMDGSEREANQSAAIKYCLANPSWKLSLQTHKIIGIP